MALGKRLINTGAAAAAACTTDSVQAFGADAAYSSNKLLYQFENNVTNDVGSPTATNSGATFSSTAKLGSYSAEFAGTTQHIDTGYSENDTSLTHSFWMYQQSITSAYNGILGNYQGGGSTYGYYLWSDPGTALNWRVHTSNSANVEVTGTISLNTWYHVVVTWSDGVGAAIYIDGVLAQFTASSSSRQQNSQELALGNIDNRGTSVVGYDGFLDQYRYYNRAVSASEAQTLYDETNATTSNTNLFNEGAGVALYTLDYDASDAGGLYDGTPTNVDFGVDGQINTGVRYSASTSSTITTPLSSSDLASNFSVSFWSKLDSPNSFQVFNGLYSKSPISNQGWVFYTQSISGSYYFGWLWYYNTSQQYNTVYNNSIPIVADTWYHVALSFTSGSQPTLYVNGVSSNTYSGGSQTSSPIYNAGSVFQIGNTPNTNVGAGDTDQVRIFNEALDSTEVGTLYSETACVYTSTTDIVNYPTGTTPVAYYKLDNSSEDFSTGGNDGTDTNIEYRFGRYGQAAVFNGSSSIIKDILGSGFTYATKTMTFSAWIFVTDNSNDNVIIADGFTNATGGWAISTGYGSAPNQKLAFSRSGSVGGVQQTYGSITIPDDTWTHIAVSVDFPNMTTNSSIKMYINGTEDTSLTDGIGYAFQENSTYNTSIGGSWSGSAGRLFEGSIDQVRIFNSALTSSQVTELYNEKPEVDTSNFKAVLYEGASSYVSNVGFQPDLLWVKGRTFTSNNRLFDVVRTASAGSLSSNQTAGNATASGQIITSFEANGFIAPLQAGDVNQSGQDFVAWNWKGGGDAVQNIQGGTNSDVSANTAAGFSIVNWSGDNSATTIGHGLNSPPEVVIRKNLGTSDWAFDTTAIDGSFDYLFLNTAAQKANHTSLSAPTSTVFSTGGTAFNSSSMIAYCWHSVSGESSISTYEGDGTNDYSKEITGLGFDPSFVMVKNVDSSGSNWEIIDSRRGDEKNLYANANYSENANSATSYGSGKFITDGFEVARGSVSSSVHWNKSGDTYIYMAFK